jgi:predicted nucleic acid-binding protein
MAGNALIDATLVHLAERESLSRILTVDHDDFETYRIKGRTRFRVVPAPDRKRWR